MSEVEVAGFTYRIGRLGPMRSWDIVRRLMPVLTAVGELASLPEFATETEDAGLDLDRILQSSGPLLAALAKMSDADSRYVIMNSLRAAERRSGQVWSPMVAVDRNTGEPLLMFEDIEMPAMLQLVFHVLQENIQRFFPSAGQNFPIPLFQAVPR